MLPFKISLASLNDDITSEFGSVFLAISEYTTDNIVKIKAQQKKLNLLVIFYPLLNI
ncbi:hypothetical protein TUM16657_06370 [Enterobacter cloacae]|nr:hypothetical protein EBZU44_00250 [Enterobacter cloacae]GJJ94564.1 hypothetical protein TUM16654_28440 [Enterobacter cloacae]GJK08046.1 hypothetical protein TUM16657_06370 [Enterobacter cloacae]